MTAIENHVLTDEGWRDLLGRLMTEQPVFGPRERPDQPGFFLFDKLQRPEDFQSDYVTTTIPPKKVFFPPEEPLFTYKLDDRPQLEMQRESGPFALVGVHPCDLAALEALDRAYGDPPAEVRWAYNRRRALVVGLDCHPDEYCFCLSTGDHDGRGPCDIFLTPIEGGYLAEVHTEDGREILQAHPLKTPGRKEQKQAEDWRRRKQENMRTRLTGDPSDVAEALEAGGLGKIWEETADRCYSCGSCNTTCPTCFCFIMNDDLDLSLKSGVRRRTWDSCQLLEFGLVAGGHNFRGRRAERVRHRWHRKFLYLYNRFNRPFCTGCGRCSRACTADINIAAVTNEILIQSGKDGDN